MRDPWPADVQRALAACVADSPAHVLASDGWARLRAHCADLAVELAAAHQDTLAGRVTSEHERLDHLLCDAISAGGVQHPIVLNNLVQNLSATLLALQRFRAQMELRDGEAARRRQEWEPPTGYVGTKEILLRPRFQKNGKNPPRMTLNVWREAAKQAGQPINEAVDPATGELYLPEAWVLDRIASWSPRTPTRRP